MSYVLCIMCILMRETERNSWLILWNLSICAVKRWRGWMVMRRRVRCGTRTLLGGMIFALSCCFFMFVPAYLKGSLFPTVWDSAVSNKTLCNILHNTVLIKSMKIKSVWNMCARNKLLDRRIKEWREYTQNVEVFAKTYYCLYLGFKGFLGFLGTNH